MRFQYPQEISRLDRDVLFRIPNENDPRIGLLRQLQQLRPLLVRLQTGLIHDQDRTFVDADDERGRIVFYAVTDIGKLTEISSNQASDLAAEANGKIFQPGSQSEPHDENALENDNGNEEPDETSEK